MVEQGSMNKIVRCLLLVAGLMPCIAGAQDYPSKVVTIVVPFTAGGSNDTVARYLAESLGKLWKQTVIVENRPGAGSSIGASYVAKSPPDGYRLLLVSNSYATNAATRTDQPYDPVKDLKAISVVGRGDVAVVVGTRVPMSSLADLAREAKAQPIFYGTAGVGSTQHFNGELLNDAMGIQMTPVAYKGGHESLVDLAGGRIDVVVGILAGLVSSIEAGKAKPIAVLGKTRSKLLPNVPTSVEAGYPGAVTESYFAVFVPAGTPDAIVDKINRDINTLTHTPDGRKFLAKVDSEPTELTAAQASERVRNDIEYWTRLAKKLNLVEK
jgi:tripartite-type tricarboxylate transporter receptor subunit TctC